MGPKKDGEQMASRGIAAYQQQADEASSKRHGGFAHILTLGDKEQVTGRFRGMLAPPAYVYPKEILLAFVDDAAVDFLAWQLGMSNEFDSISDFAEKVLARYQNIEPFAYSQHYNASARGPLAYNTCGVSWEPQIQCVGCYLKDSGSKNVSLRPQAAFNFVPRRKVHRVPASVRGQKDDWIYCSRSDDDGSICRQCNSGLEARWDGMKYFSLAGQHAGVLLAAADRASKRCAFCGVGMVRHQGYCCPNPACGEPQNWVPGDVRWKCGACGYDPWTAYSELYGNTHQFTAKPDELLACSKGCATPRRVQLYDIDYLVQRIGKDKTTTYSFTEQVPATPLEDELLKFRLCSFEHKLKPRSVDEQARSFGLHQNPWTGHALAPPPAGGTVGYEQEQTEGYEDDGSQQPFGR